MSMQTTLRNAVIAASLGAATATLVAPLLAAITLRVSAQDAPGAVGIDNFTWTNKDDIPHTIAAVSKQFKSKALDTGDAYSFTFTTPGAYEYFCSLHPHMTGTIVVEAATGSNAAQ